MKLSQAKTLGGVGAILSLVGGFIPYAGGIAAIVGVVLLLIAVKYISEETKDRSIFTNYLAAFVIGIVAIIVAIAAFIAFIGVDVLFHFARIKEIESLMSLKHLIIGLLMALLVFWILYLIAAIFLKKSYYKIAEYTGVGLFHTTGLLYLIGAATLIVVIGFFILFIAKIIEIIAYFSLPETIQKEEEQEAI